MPFQPKFVIEIDKNCSDPSDDLWRHSGRGLLCIHKRHVYFLQINTTMMPKKYLPLIWHKNLMSQSQESLMLMQDTGLTHL